jgi:hypothetical protein
MAIEQGQPLSSADRRWLSTLLLTLANAALEYRPAHRMADNGMRDFHMTVDKIVTGEPAKVVARRWRAWGIKSESNVRQIVQRMRADVNRAISESKYPPAALLRVAAAYRDRTGRTSVTD